jgi:hypothetical protein
MMPAFPCPYESKLSTVNERPTSVQYLHQKPSEQKQSLVPQAKKLLSITI